jgi:hypothetical protein
MVEPVLHNGVVEVVSRRTGLEAEVFGTAT